MNERDIRHYYPWELTSYREVRDYVEDISDFSLGTSPILADDKEVGKVEVFELDENSFIQLVLMNNGRLTTYVCGKNRYKIIQTSNDLENVARGTKSLF